MTRRGPNALPQHRRRTGWLVGETGIILLALIALAAPANSTPRSPQDDPTASDLEERVDVRLVQMAILAKDRRGDPVEDLVPADIVARVRGRKVRVAFLEPFCIGPGFPRNRGWL